MLKKILKTVLWLVAFIVVLLVGAAIALQSPLVQTYAAKKLIAALEDSIDGTIHIEKVHFRPFNAIVIKNFEIIDDNPYTAEADTFARAGIITANFKLTSLLEGKGVQISKAYVKDGYMLLTIEPGSTDTTSTTNLGRIFRLPEEEEEE